MARKSKLTTDFTAKDEDLDEEIAALIERKRQIKERLDRERREQDGELMQLAGLNKLAPDVKLGLLLDAAKKAKSKPQLEAWARIGADFHEQAKRARTAKRHGENGQDGAAGVASGEQGGGEASTPDVSQAA